jgi:transcription antitermination protein NusB
MTLPAPIPARLTASQLAEALQAPLTDVQTALEARGESSGAGDILGPTTSEAVASALGKRIMIEPRDLALEALYEYESRDGLDSTSLPVRAAELVNGVISERERLDGAIEAASDHWSVARMPVVDRTIIRIGLYELETHPEVPTAVVVNEAVRLAKSYSTERSGAFVNGVLSSLAKDVRSGH